MVDKYIIICSGVQATIIQNSTSLSFSHILEEMWRLGHDVGFHSRENDGVRAGVKAMCNPPKPDGSAVSISHT
jgi:hypothetical protein